MTADFGKVIKIRQYVNHGKDILGGKCDQIYEYFVGSQAFLI